MKMLGSGGSEPRPFLGASILFGVIFVLMLGAYGQSFRAIAAAVTGAFS